jgi:hypothetical protein
MSIVGSALKQVDKVAPLLKFRLAAEKSLAPAIRIVGAHGPEILTGLGLVTGAATVVLASTATLKLEDIVDDAKVDLDGLKELQEEQKAALETTDFTGSSFARDKTKIYVRTVGRITKIYAPAITTGVVSVSCILGAHGIMRQRNAALTAAYLGVEKAYEMYRKRVIEEFGEQKDQDFRLGFKEEVVKDKKSGDNKTVTHIKKNANGYSEYVRCFDENNPNWVEQSDYNLNYLHAKQNFWNNRLQGRGFVFLNEVYQDMGFEPTQAGQAVGWAMGADGDNYIDFGIYDLDNDKKRMFVNGREKAIWLDFNVDGVVWDKLKKQ